MKFYILASPRAQCLRYKDIVFFRFPSKYRVKDKQTLISDRIHQNKQGFVGKKLSEGQAGRNSFRFHNMCLQTDESAIGDRHPKILAVFLPRCSC